MEARSAFPRLPDLLPAERPGAFVVGRLQVPADFAAVCEVAAAEYGRQEFLLLQDLQVQHGYGEKGEKQQSPVEKGRQDSDVQQVETDERRIAADAEYPRRDKLRPVFFGNAGPPAVAHGVHGGSENDDARPGQT